MITKSTTETTVTPTPTGVDKEAASSPSSSPSTSTSRPAASGETKSNKNGSEKTKSRVSVMQEGKIESIYNMTHALHIKPSLSIGKIEFNVVPKGTGGKNGYSVYMSTDEMDLWTRDYFDRVMEQRIKEETDQGATFKNNHYKYKTGANAAKEVNLMASTKMFGCFNIKGIGVDGGYVSQNFTVSEATLNAIFTWYRTITEEWRKQLAQECLAEADSHRQKDVEE